MQRMSNNLTEFTFWWEEKSNRDIKTVGSYASEGTSERQKRQWEVGARSQWVCMGQSEDLGFSTEIAGDHWKVLIRGEKHPDLGLSRVTLAALENLRKESRGRSRTLL